MRKSYFEPAVEFFDRSSVPPAIAELWDEWRELDADTARLVRAAVSLRSPRQLRLAWEMLAARAKLARAGGLTALLVAVAVRVGALS